MDYITAKQFAEKCGVSESTIRAWISRGKLPDIQKFGNAWMIPADTPKPEDQRYVENPVRNRRKVK